MADALDIAISGLNAADTQVAVAATNIADGQVAGAPPPSQAPFGSSAVAAPPLTGTQPSNAPAQVFQALQAVQTAQQGGGANVSVSRSPEYDISFQPDSPQADSQGLVATPNVNPIQQTVELITAANSAASAAQSITTNNAITQRVLDLTT